MNVSSIFFDMYGVILEESKGRFIPYTFERFPQSEYSRLTHQLRDEQLFTRASNGEFTSDEFLHQLGFEETQYHMNNYIEEYLTLDPGFVPFAKKNFNKFDFVLVSNDLSEWGAYITEYYKLNKYFKEKIVSGDVGCRKPDRKIYEIALEKTGKKAEECYFVDNSVKNLETAAMLGFVPILFNRDAEEYDGLVVNNFAELAKLIEKQN